MDSFLTRWSQWDGPGGLSENAKRVSVRADGTSGVFVHEPLGFAPDNGAGLMRKRQTRKPAQSLQSRMGTIHIAANHGQSDLMTRFVACDLEIRSPQALVIGLGARDLLLQGLHSRMFGSAMAHATILLAQHFQHVGQVRQVSKVRSGDPYRRWITQPQCPTRGLRFTVAAGQLCSGSSCSYAHF
jgi:hypothetical protein